LDQIQTIAAFHFVTSPFILFEVLPNWFARLRGDRIDFYCQDCPHAFAFSLDAAHVDGSIYSGLRFEDRARLNGHKCPTATSGAAGNVGRVLPFPR
jgi:hypothetical protein